MPAGVEESHGARGTHVLRKGREGEDCADPQALFLLCRTHRVHPQDHQRWTCAFLRRNRRPCCEEKGGAHQQSLLPVVYRPRVAALPSVAYQEDMSK